MSGPKGLVLTERDHVVSAPLQPSQLAGESLPRHDVPAWRFAVGGERVVAEDDRRAPRATPEAAVGGLPDSGPVGVPRHECVPGHDSAPRQHEAERTECRRRHVKGQRCVLERAAHAWHRQLAGPAERQVRKHPGVPLVQLHGGPAPGDRLREHPAPAARPVLGDDGLRSEHEPAAGLVKPVAELGVVLELEPGRIAPDQLEVAATDRAIAAVAVPERRRTLLQLVDLPVRVDDADARVPVGVVRNPPLDGADDDGAR
jgi:hypothetical protein